ncbi:MAG TPA: hypothetical protein VM243_00250 [Phycisphaerae bacterium]|nr:hypothetical protein [Phycisphaerae bacterium]
MNPSILRPCRFCAVLFVAAFTLLGCSAGPGGGTDGQPPDFPITGKQYMMPLGEAGVFGLSDGGDPVQAGVAVELFSQTPTDSPSDCTLFLALSDVQLQDAADTGARTITVGVHIGAASANPCNDGVQVGSFTLSYDGAAVSLVTDELSLSGSALAYACSGRFTVCLTVSGDMGATLRISQLGLRFAPPEGGDDGVPDQPVSQESEGPPEVNLVVEEDSRATEMIPAETGGTVTATGSTTMVLEIPPGALSEDTEVSLTIASDRENSPYTYVGLFEPAGLELSEAATLVITLDPPLSADEALNVVEIPVSSSAAKPIRRGSSKAGVRAAAEALGPPDMVDTGFVASTSADGTTVTIPLENLNTGTGAVLNCHGHSVRRIIQALQLKRNMSKGQIVDAIMDRHIDQGLGEGSNDAAILRAQLEESFDNVMTRPGEADASWHILQAYLNTFYRLSGVRLDAELEGAKQVKQDAGGGYLIDASNPACLAKLAALARTSDLPPIFNFGRSFPTDWAGPGSDDGLRLSKDMPHSGALRLVNGEVVIENGASLTKQRAAQLAQARQQYLHDNPELAELWDYEMPPDRVVPLPLTDLDRLRTMRSGEAIKADIKRWGGDVSSVTTGNGIPWPAVRVWVPEGVYRELCKVCAAATDCDNSLFCDGAEACGSDKLCTRGPDPCPNQACDEGTDKCKEDGGGGAGVGSVPRGVCWEMTLTDAVAHLDVISGLPDDIPPGSIPDQMTAADSLGQAAGVILKFDDSGRLDSLWLRLPEAIPELGVEMMEFVRLTRPNVLLAPGLTYSDVRQDVSVSSDGSRLSFEFGFTMNFAQEGASAKVEFSYAVRDAAFVGNPANRFESGSYSAEIYSEATAPELEGTVRMRVTGTATAAGTQMASCPDPNLDVAMSQEEALALMEEDAD